MDEIKRPFSRIIRSPPAEGFHVADDLPNLPGLDTFIKAMIALAVSIGLLVIFLSMYTTVLERTRDIGVLKSLAPARSDRASSARETSFICLLGIAVGVDQLSCAGLFLSIFPDAVDFDYSRNGSCGPPHCIRRSAVSAPAIPPGWPAARTRRGAFLRLVGASGGPRSEMPITLQYAIADGTHDPREASGTDTQNRKSLEAVSRGKGRSPGTARRQFQGIARRSSLP